MTPEKAIEIAQRAVANISGATSDFDLNNDLPRPKARFLKPAAVLFAIDTSNGCPSVLLTKRASNLKHHPGQIAFPGGKVDALDNGSVIAAALREAHEEIGLPTGIVELVGELPTHETVTNFSVSPVIGIVTQPFDSKPEMGEVEEVFRVPLTHLTNRNNYVVQWRVWQGTKRHYYVVPFGPYYIWGATARILKNFADRASL